MNLQDHLKLLDACADAREWVGDRTATQAWNECTRADWLFWWARRTDANKVDGPLLWKRCAEAALEIAESVGHLVKAGEERPKKAIEAARLYLSDPTPKNLAGLQTARRGADAVADAAAYAAYAAYAAAAGADAAYAAALTKQRAANCEIIRRHLVCPWVESV